jgi:hypothetical protein
MDTTITNILIFPHSQDQSDMQDAPVRHIPFDTHCKPQPFQTGRSPSDMQ